MVRGEQSTPGNTERNSPVDYRFARAVETALATEFAPPDVRLDVSQMAAGLNVSRTTIYAWLRGIHGISRGAVQPFLDCDDWRGVFARRVWEIHEDHIRWRREAIQKEFSVWWLTATCARSRSAYCRRP